MAIQTFNDGILADQLRALFNSNFSEIATRLGQLESALDGLATDADLTAINLAITNLTNSINTLNTNYNNLSTIVGQIQTNTNTNTTNIAALTTSVNNNSSDIGDINAAIGTLTDSINAINTSISTINNNITTNTNSINTLNTRLGGVTILQITEAAYTALAVKDPATLYLING